MSTTETPYIPEGVVISKSPTFRIAIIGAPGSGKTTATLTFPNRIYLDYDNKLPAGEQAYPFWDPAFCDSLAKPSFKGIPDVGGATKKWWRDNVTKFKAGQTIIKDSWTMMQNGFDRYAQIEAETSHRNSEGKVDNFWFWGEKQRFSKEICQYLKACKATVVVTFHEAPERNEKGELNGKLRAVMDGGFKDQLLGHFTDVWHQVANIPEKTANGMSKIENGKVVVKSIQHKGIQWVWFWKLVGDSLIDCNMNPDLGEKVRAKNINLVPADWEEIQKLLGTNNNK